ncbi:MAG: putative porin [Bacteroidota bacterium]|nr:putative porin [Bacteroidota bacterium]
MSLFKRIFILIFLFFVFQESYSQDIKTTGNSSTTKYFYENSLRYSDRKGYYSIDTTLINFEKYNPAEIYYNYFTNLGNIGTASKSILFEGLKSNGFDFGIHTYDCYSDNEKEIKYYITKTPYTQIIYINGQKNENYFNLIYSQNIRKGWNAGIKYNVINSNGFYKRQISDNIDFCAFTSYASKNKRYNLYANYISNTFMIDENGGIVNDADFEHNAQKNKALYDVNLTTSQNKINRKNFYISQYYDLGKKITEGDDTIEKFSPSYRISNTFNYERKCFIYLEQIPNQNFYHDFYFNSQKTYDSTYFQKFEDQLSFFNTDHYKSVTKLKYILSAKYQHVRIYQNYKDTLFNNLTYSAELFNSIRKGFNYYFSAIYTSSGYNKNDASISSVFSFYPNDSVFIKSKFRAEISYKMIQPSYYENIYNSNNFCWKNNFDKIKQFAFDISYDNKIFDIKLRFFNLTNYVYFDDSILLKQTNKQQNIACLILNKNFKFGNWYLNNSFVYQNPISSSVIRLPQFISKQSLFYKSSFFKHKLNYIIGTDVNYYTSYKADSYMPALSSFYLQNDKSIGNYAFIDLFFNVKIKRMLAFIKFEHINSGMFGYTYYLVPYYPAADRSFKFGLQWSFYD